jgi:hypothetical protein
MLRINLLPAYVAQRRLRAQCIVISTVVYVGLVVLLCVAFGVLSSNLAKATSDAQTAHSAKLHVDSLNTEATTKLASIPAMSDMVKFVDDLNAYNVSFNKLYLNVFKYTSNRILLHSLKPSGTSTLTIDGYAPNLDAMTRYMQALYQEPDFSNVTFSALPVYGAQQAESVNTVTIPQLPAGYVAHFPGHNDIAVRSFTVTDGVITDINPSTASTSSTSAAPTSPGMGQMGQGSQSNQAGQMMQQMMQQRMQAQGQGQGQGQGGAAGRVQLDAGGTTATVSRPYRFNMGFDFTVTATIKTPPVAPTPPGSTSSGSSSSSGNSGYPGAMGMGGGN